MKKTYLSPAIEQIAIEAQVLTTVSVKVESYSSNVQETTVGDVNEE